MARILRQPGSAATDVAHGPLIEELARRARLPRRDLRRGGGRPAVARVGLRSGRFHRGQAGRGIPADPDLCQPRPPDRQHRPARAHGSTGPEGAGTGLPRAGRGRPRHRVPDRQSQRGDQAAAQAARDHRAAQAHLLRHDRRRVCARSDETERLWLQEHFQVGRMHQAFRGGRTPGTSCGT